MGRNNRTVFGEGFLEVDLPRPLSNPKGYRWDDIVTIHAKDSGIGVELEFPLDLVGTHGALVAVVCRDPRPLNPVDQRIRRNIATPPKGSEIVLGTGKVHIRTRTIGGSPGAHFVDNAIGVKPRLDGDAVRSLFCQWVRLELHR